MADGDIGAETFAEARGRDRAQASLERAARRAQALSRLHAARDAFIEQASLIGPAARDADRLERLGERLVAFVDDLEPLIERLEVAPDVTARLGGPRRMTRLDPATLAAALAETLGEALLSGPAQAVLNAAVVQASC